jgi:hypothetical protein
MLVVNHLNGFMMGHAVHTKQFTANASDYNMASDMDLDASFGSIEIIVDSGVVVSATGAGTPAMATGTTPASIFDLSIVNNGEIEAAGGAGGNGGAGNSLPGSAGSAGGDALDLEMDATITNGSGKIWGGGGGGGGGGANFPSTGSGGGGGGGAGVAGGAGGAVTVGSGIPLFGTAGSGGTASSGGSGGTGDTNTSPNGGDGGAGGGPGAVGAAGSAGLGAGGAAGAAGKAIELNGNSVTWVSGSGDPNVKGAVS